MEKRFILGYILSIICLAGIIYFTIKTRRFIQIPRDAKEQHVPGFYEFMYVDNIGYQLLSFSYILFGFGAAVLYVKPQPQQLQHYSSILFFLATWILSYLWGGIWTYIRIRYSHVVEETTMVEETDEKSLVKLRPLPLWIDISFAIGSILSSALISYLFI